MGLIKRVQAVGLSENLINSGSGEEMGCLKNFKYEIDLIEDPKLEIFPSRKIPHSIRDKIKEELDRMEGMGIIKQITEPTPAVSPMVIVRRNGKIRVCMDPSSLNKNLKRRHYPLNTLEEIASRINGSKWFSLLDCKKGFWQIPVTERTSKYLTMATPWGRYVYLRMPMGLSSAPEVFQQKMELLLRGLEGVECAMDDILVHAPTKKQAEERTEEVKKIFKEAGLMLNSEKCIYLQNEVKFLGHIVTDKGLKADDEKVKAISSLKVPENVEALQRFLGMVTYLAKFITNLSEITRPLRDLCKKNVEWVWDTEQQSSFEKLKESLKNLPILKFYDVNAPVTVSVDASKHAVGAVLLQEGRPVAYATKALDKTQQNYSQIEKEAFAIKFGCLRFHQYVWGCKDLIVETDHKPLTSISKKPLHLAPPRLQRLMFDILPYRPKIIYKKGTELFIADTLSRDCEDTGEQEIPEMKIEVHVVVPITDSRTEQLIRTLKTDEEMSTLMKLVREGWPDSINQVPECVKKYWTFRDEFAVYEDVLFRGDRVVIPPELRKRTLETIHLGHLGIQRSLSRARENVYWHKMNEDVINLVKRCKVCQHHQRDGQEEPLILNEIPKRPWQIVAIDIYHCTGKDYLVIADSYSGYYDFCILGSLSSSCVIKALKQWFSVHGIPVKLCSDEGSQLISKEFLQFAEEWNFTLQTSSPYHKRSNGLAERYVQEAKRLLSKCAADGSDIYLALLNTRNTPRGILGSPVQRLMGRQTKGVLPTTEKLLKPQIIKNVQANLKAMRLVDKEYRDRGSKFRTPISVGQRVLFRKAHRNWSPAQVISPAKGPRSFLIKTPEGAIYRRNSWFLQPDTTSENTSPAKEESHSEEDSIDETDTSDVRHDSPSPSSCASGPQGLLVETPKIKTRSGRVVKPPNRLNL